MSFIFCPMNTEYANEIAYTWKYDGEYSFYDMTADEEDLAEFLNSENWPGHYFAVLNDESQLIGFFTYSIENGKMWISLGLKPELTGKGIGADFVAAGIQFGVETLNFSQGCVMLSVASFIMRAIRAYEKAGFNVIEKYTQATNNKEFEFTKMKKLLGQQ